MATVRKIHKIYPEASITLAMDTIKLNKQALVFTNTKRSAERTAEEIAKQIGDGNGDLLKIALEAKSSLSSPTKQCERLSYCLRKGIAFHHAGLTQQQKSLVEERFRKGDIKVICCTPTLAYGVDLPAFRAIIKDLKRFGRHGMAWIPVLDYLQQAGRAGRPKYDSFGEAIAIAQTDAEKEKIYEMYVKGEPEEIESKLAVEPALRMYTLSLIATGIASSEDELHSFFEKSFWAHQYSDDSRLGLIVDRILEMLEEWEFLRRSEKGNYVASPIGQRVSELCIDPYTAYLIIECLRKAEGKNVDDFSFLNMISSTFEMRPLLNAKTRELDELQKEAIRYHDAILTEEPSMFEPEYDNFLDGIKTSLMFVDWIEEKTEEHLLERYDVRPGELQVKLEMADWLLYTAQELCNLLHFPALRRKVSKCRVRVKYGVKEELLPLVRLQHIGRIRARKLYINKIRDLGDIKKADMAVLSQLLGKNIAASVKKQVGEVVEDGKAYDWVPVQQ